MKNVPWYGPIYYEAARFEEKLGAYERAGAVVTRGLGQIPRYGPLWFAKFRILEKLEAAEMMEAAVKAAQRTAAAVSAAGDGEHSDTAVFSVDAHFPRTRKAYKKAASVISRELLWKVFLEQGQFEQRVPAMQEETLASVNAILDKVVEGVAPRSRAAVTITRGLSTAGPPTVVALVVLRDDEEGRENARGDDGKGGSRIGNGSDADEEDGKGGSKTRKRRVPTWLKRTRAAFVRSVLAAPNNLRWKVWIAGARAELIASLNDGEGESQTSNRFGERGPSDLDLEYVVQDAEPESVEFFFGRRPAGGAAGDRRGAGTARALLHRAFEFGPRKSRPQTLIEASRLEEALGRPHSAREMLRRARVSTRREWKVYLESVLFEERQGNCATAASLAAEALRKYSGTGRLWAVLLVSCEVVMVFCFCVSPCAPLFFSSPLFSSLPFSSSSFPFSSSSFSFFALRFPFLLFFHTFLSPFLSISLRSFPLLFSHLLFSLVSSRSI